MVILRKDPNYPIGQIEISALRWTKTAGQQDTIPIGNRTQTIAIQATAGDIYLADINGNLPGSGGSAYWTKKAGDPPLKICVIYSQKTETIHFEVAVDCVVEVLRVRRI